MHSHYIFKVNICIADHFEDADVRVQIERDIPAPAYVLDESVHHWLVVAPEELVHANSQEQRFSEHFPYQRKNELRSGRVHLPLHRRRREYERNVEGRDECNLRVTTGQLRHEPVDLRAEFCVLKMDK